MDEEPQFAVTLFSRVFDTEPTRDVVSLTELTEGLSRYIVKPKLRRQLIREKQRIDQAWEAYCAGEVAGGKRLGWINQAAKRGGKEAARAEYEQMLAKAASRAKTDLRIWSPTHYPNNSRRGSDNVVHLSCLVLDYDHGTTIEMASEDWDSWYHIIHTTWSHSADEDRFRVILPLASPVKAMHWRSVWTWAAERIGMTNDPSCKSESSTYALPVTPSLDSPRVSIIRGGPLLDTVVHGLTPDAAAPPVLDSPAEPNHFRGGNPDDKTVQEAASSPEDESWDVDDAFENLF